VLYLFNSAFRPLYVKNVLNTLFLPEGHTNEYRYRYRGEPRYITAATYGKLASLEAGTECLVCFIDRFGAGGYDYHPLRLGKYLSRREANDYLYFRIQLGAFLYPRNQAAFKQQLLQALGPLELPTLTNNNPENTGDGAYAILADSIFGQSDEYMTGDAAWTEAVENLSKTRALATNADQSPLFFRVDVHQRSTHNKLIRPIIQNEASMYEFEKDKNYELSLTYRFPRQRIEPAARAQAAISWGQSLRPPGTTSINVDSHANSLLLSFGSRRYVEENLGAISISPVNESGQPGLLMSDYVIQYRIRESTGFWFQTIGALLAFSLAGAFIGVDFSKLSPFSASALFTAAWPKLIAGVIQTGALYWVFRLFGKKLL
jgi:hypothetical protein